jgi:hypothetical protein
MESLGEMLVVSNRKNTQKRHKGFSVSSERDNGIINGDRDLKGNVSSPWVHTHSHCCLEIVAISPEFRIR